MKNVRYLVAFGLILLVTSCITLPTPTITRTHLMKDIEKSTLTITAGIEGELGIEPAYLGDWLFGYVGFAPADWLELGIAAHSPNYGLSPAIDAKIDVVDIFYDDTRLSCLLQGGIGGQPNEALFYHGGLALNLRLLRYLQLFAGAGTDNISDALNLQAGVYVGPWHSLGLITAVKYVIGPDGREFMISIAPMLTSSRGADRCR